MINKILMFLAVIGGFLLSMFIFRKKPEIKTMTGYEEEKKETVQKIKRQTLMEKLKEAEKYFRLFVLALFLCVSCQGRDLLIVPEKPRTPKINFQAEKDRVFLTEHDFTELLIYLELSEKYDKKFDDFLKGLRK